VLAWFILIPLLLFWSLSRLSPGGVFALSILNITYDNVTRLAVRLLTELRAELFVTGYD
jgi:hypothetical protein